MACQYRISPAYCLFVCVCLCLGKKEAIGLPLLPWLGGVDILYVDRYPLFSCNCFFLC